MKQNNIMDHRIKKNLIQMNIYHCKYGIYKNCVVSKSEKNYYNNDYITPPPIQYCVVDVRKNHPLDVAYEYSYHGYNPVVTNIVSEEFTGNDIDSSEGMKDEYMNIRTNFNRTINVYDMFPIKEREVVYAPIVYIIRNSNMEFVNPLQLRKISMITVSIKSNPSTIGGKLTVKSYMEMKEKIETVFQTANTGGNDVVVLNDFGCTTDKYPYDDIIEIINGCVYKYGHMFKYIVIAMLIRNESSYGYLNMFNQNIVRPQKIKMEYLLS